ncbi:MAG: ABC transporter ATP-binding protein/permease, partial [Firmicutes bacterium]|nr:ABC transporter ATP-binding protein/permease [Bacillota bacterium]
LFMGAIAAFSGWLGGIAGNINTLKRANVDANDLRAFFEFTNRMDPANPASIADLGRDISIEFRNVSFRYSGSLPYVLKNLNFVIGAKEKAALVGVNGAGKTTIVKLLCGFYKATSGEILFNNRNIDEFKREDLYGLFSAVFQDMCILPFSVAENITFQRKEEQDKDHIWNCLEAAGIKDVVMANSKGLDASMTKIIDEDGLILSGGQQQKLTIARALYKDAPVLILDEPTAALDPIAESEVYEKFHEVTENKTAIYISHRLASTRFCDKILMLDNGQIIENGSHAQLVAHGGEYAKMFEIQSHYYQDSVPGEVTT